jgi:TonB family protein
MKSAANSLKISRARCAVPGILFSFLLGSLLLSAPPLQAGGSDPASSDPGVPHASTIRKGTLETREGLTLHLNSDLGSVHVVPLDRSAPPVVRYAVRIETDARGTLAQELLDRYSLSARSTPAGVEISGNLPAQTSPNSANSPQFWVHFEISVPPSYSLDINTGAGDIRTGNIGGTASLITQGGNIFTGNIGVYGARNIALGRPVARLETQGGHIHVQDVAGDLSAFTAGGHIVTGNVAGDATLRTGGGHITAAGIGGRAELSTEGGNITVGRAGSVVGVKTGGGQIDFGEVHGSVRAQTGGGGIRIMYVAGPMEVESTGGSICLTQVAGSVRAATGDGTITAWINPDSSSSKNSPSSAVQLAGASQLASGAGDIVVFLPRNLAANIEATVENGGEQRIEADPALALQFQKSSESGTVHAIAMLNGGGAPLRLRTIDGRIRLRFLDSEVKLRDSLIRDQLARLRRDFPDMPPPPTLAPVALRQDAPPQAMPEMAPAPPAAPQEAPSGWTGSWIDKLELTILGGVREDADEFQTRLVYAPKPVYPEIARRAGVEGIVRLQVRLTRNGHIEVQKLLEGEPSLADAAISAVRNWKGKPVVLNGKPVDVISTVTFNFQLH